MLNTIKAKSLKESGIITEYTSTKLVCLEAHGSPYAPIFIFSFVMAVPILMFILFPALMMYGDWIFSSVYSFFIALFIFMVIISPLLWMIYQWSNRTRDDENTLETFYIFDKFSAEISQDRKTDKGNTKINKYGFTEVEKILLKKVADDHSDTYYVLILLSEGEKLPIHSGGFSNKTPALDLAECINQFMNLPPDSIEIIHEVIG
jgi:hypothetical protein